MRLAIILAVALATWPAVARDVTAERLLGSVLMLVSVSELCDLPVTPEQLQAMAAAGERLQTRAGIPDDVLEDLVAESGVEARRLDCATAARAFPAHFAAVMAEADGLR